MRLIRSAPIRAGASARASVSHLGQTERSRRRTAGTRRTLRRTGRLSGCGSRGCGAACRRRRTGRWRRDRHLGGRATQSGTKIQGGQGETGVRSKVSSAFKKYNRFGAIFARIYAYGACSTPRANSSGGLELSPALTRYQNLPVIWFLKKGFFLFLLQPTRLHCRIQSNQIQRSRTRYRVIRPTTTWCWARHYSRLHRLSF